MSQADVPDAIAARTGNTVFSHDEWHALADALRLSGRELEIVQCIFDDEKESSIARHLGMSVHTVHTHIGRLYRKLDASSRVDVIVRIFQEHLARIGRLHGNGSSACDCGGVRHAPSDYHSEAATSRGLNQ